MRDRFESQLIRLNNELIAMGALCEDAISCAVKYLTEKNDVLKENAVDAERQLDQKEREVETFCMRILMRQQPVARDLRTISSALKMISDMERIGDQAADIAEISEYVTFSGIESEIHIAEMAQVTAQMVTDSIDSFVKKDVDMAHSAISLDNVVDDLFLTVKNELINAVQTGHGDAESLIDLLMIAKYFERIGDHAENIAEWVIYSITGEH